jgi:hypothetical protein
LKKLGNTLLFRNQFGLKRQAVKSQPSELFYALNWTVWLCSDLMVQYGFVDFQKLKESGWNAFSFWNGLC